MTDSLEAAANSIERGAQTVMLGNAVVNIALSGSLNQLWGMINSLQIVVHTPLVDVSFPENAKLVYKQMILVATFDVLPTDDWFPEWFDLPEADSFSESFADLNYDSAFLVVNLGTIFFVVIYYIIMYLAFFVTVFFSNDIACCMRYRGKL